MTIGTTPILQISRYSFLSLEVLCISKDSHFDKFIDPIEKVDILTMFVGRAKLTELVHKFTVDSPLLQHVLKSRQSMIAISRLEIVKKCETYHEHVVQVAVNDVASNCVPFLIPVLTIKHCDLINGKHVI